MGRRIGMWATVICILVVGISVTKLTSSFVTSNTAETAAASDMRSMTQETAAAAAGSVQSEAGAVPGDPGQAAGSAQRAAEAPVADAVPQAAAFSVNPAAADSAETGKTESRTAEKSASESAVEAEAEVIAEDTGTQNGTPDTAEDMAASETVKSPLDPVVTKENTAETEENLTAFYAAEDFLKRFENAETCSGKFWENVSADNVGAASAAAEQERALWDYELNLVYRTIRSRMTEQEAEELKILELEWLKERDRYADKEAGKTAGINGISPDYTKALTIKTKERCYWLVSQYEEVLSRSAANGTVKE